MLPGEATHVRKAGNSVIVAFENQSEDDDWDDGTGWMGSLMSLRSELLRGDIRCLYLGWLLCAQNEEFAEDDLEPAVPAGLGELSAPFADRVSWNRREPCRSCCNCFGTAERWPGSGGTGDLDSETARKRKEQFARCRALRTR